MKGFFTHLYEWFGLVPIYSKDMSDFLKGWDYAGVGYFALPWYVLIGLSMIILTVLIFVLQNDLISSTRFKTAQHWELAALVVIIVNFLIAFAVPFVAILKHIHCPLLKLTVSDSIFFGLSNAVWAFILFSLLSIIARIVNPMRK